MCIDNNVRGNDEYFKYTVDNLETSDYPKSDGWIDIEALANMVEDTEEDFGISEIRDVLWEIEDMRAESEE